MWIRNVRLYQSFGSQLMHDYVDICNVNIDGKWQNFNTAFLIWKVELHTRKVGNNKSLPVSIGSHLMPSLQKSWSKIFIIKSHFINDFMQFHSIWISVARQSTSHSWRGLKAMTRFGWLGFDKWPLGSPFRWWIDYSIFIIV